MNPTATVMRWYRQSTSGGSAHQQYTPEEVLQHLRPDPSAPERYAATQDCATNTNDRRERSARSQAVQQIAAQPATWLAHVTGQQRREIGALADRLPALLFHHTTGGEPGDLLQRFGGWSTWRYERALDIAAACIASCLNQRQLVA